jgi:hypothetical protein
MGHLGRARRGSSDSVTSSVMAAWDDGGAAQSYGRAAAAAAAGPSCSDGGAGFGGGGDARGPGAPRLASERLQRLAELNGMDPSVLEELLWQGMSEQEVGAAIWSDGRDLSQSDPNVI